MVSIFVFEINIKKDKKGNDDYYNKWFIIFNILRF
jgi:hypothetical protein